MCIVGNTRKAGDLWIKSTRTTMSIKKKKKKAPEQEMVQFIKPLSKIKVKKRAVGGIQVLHSKTPLTWKIVFCHMTVCSVLMGFTKKTKTTGKASARTQSFNHPSRIRKVK